MIDAMEDRHGHEEEFRRTIAEQRLEAERTNNEELRKKLDEAERYANNQDKEDAEDKVAIEKEKIQDAADAKEAEAEKKHNTAWWFLLLPIFACIIAAVIMVRSRKGRW